MSRRLRYVAGLVFGPEGALALLDDRARVVELAPMPVLANGRAGRAEVDPVALAALLRHMRPREVVVDRIQWAPRRGRASWFRGRGVAEGVMAALALPIGLVLDAPCMARIADWHAEAAVRRQAVSDWPALAETFGLGPASLARAAELARARLRDRGVIGFHE